MLRYQQQFTFFDIARVDESVRYINLSQQVVNGTLKRLLERIIQEVEQTSPCVVIVDSFRTVAQTADRTQVSDLDLQYFVQQLVVRLTGWEATTSLVGEYEPSAAEQNPVFTVADGVLWLLQSLDRNSTIKTLYILGHRRDSAPRWPSPSVRTPRGIARPDHRGRVFASDRRR